ncbi:MAG: hypothetical protein B6D73_10725 [gamma proteobacterium symbiont of Stewartia floridana]|nr:MAG: hypothetical protein B6D73_10725 [gamma proteobacterium symbiont of Stewartia floridana]
MLSKKWQYILFAYVLLVIATVLVAVVTEKTIITAAVLPIIIAIAQVAFGFASVQLSKLHQLEARVSAQIRDIKRTALKSIGRVLDASYQHDETPSIIVAEILKRRTDLRDLMSSLEDHEKLAYPKRVVAELIDILDNNSSVGALDISVLNNILLEKKYELETSF